MCSAKQKYMKNILKNSIRKLRPYPRPCPPLPAPPLPPPLPRPHPAPSVWSTKKKKKPKKNQKKIPPKKKRPNPTPPPGGGVRPCAPVVSVDPWTPYTGPCPPTLNSASTEFADPPLEIHFLPNSNWVGGGMVTGKRKAPNPLPHDAVGIEKSANVQPLSLKGPKVVLAPPR